MIKTAFISRHQPTPEQFALAAAEGFSLEHVGDRDAFTIDPSEFGRFEAVCVVHAAAALRLITTHTVLIFENGSRPGEDGKPSFFAKSVQVYYLQQGSPAYVEQVRYAPYKGIEQTVGRR